MAAVVAGLAGWAAVAGTGELLGGAAGAVRSLAQGLAGGVVVLLGYAAAVYPLDRADVRPLATTLTCRVRRGHRKEGT